MSLDEYIFMAKVAESAEKFDDMVYFLKKAIKSKFEDFTPEERNLI